MPSLTLSHLSLQNDPARPTLEAYFQTNDIHAFLQKLAEKIIVDGEPVAGTPGRVAPTLTPRLMVRCRYRATLPHTS